jgi:hypothetical protein
LALDKTNLETFLFSLIITIYFYSILLNVQTQIQKKLRILLIYNFNYLPLVCIVKRPKILNRSKFKKERNYSNNKNNKKKEEKETKNCKVKNKRNDKKNKS